MTLHDTLQGLKDFWSEFRKVKMGVVGLAILIGFLLLGLFGPLLVPFPGATQHWRDISFWQDNPRTAPPVWAAAIGPVKSVPSSLITNHTETEEQSDGGATVKQFVFTFDDQFDNAPNDMLIRFSGIAQIPVSISLSRPDGLEVELFSDQIDFGSGSDQRISLNNNARQGTIAFVREHDPEQASQLIEEFVKTNSILFSKMDKDITGEHSNPLKGKYTFTIKSLLLTPEAKIEKPSILVAGSASGILGTDGQKRDLFTGIVLGIKWALIIGILTSLLSVFLGISLGVTAAYFGGRVDWLLNRLFEFVANLPVLPFLIVISAVFKPTIWTIIIIICLFFWSGVFKPTYSMALQIKEETFVEASRALGASRIRIIFKHIIPILLPYAFASIALLIPGVIVYEATLSLLGLGDPSIVSWGGILEDASRGNAVVSNIWWWVIPPGLMIALMGMSFAFLGTALDKILHPKLRTR